MLRDTYVRFLKCGKEYFTSYYVFHVDIPWVDDKDYETYRTVLGVETMWYLVFNT